MSPEIPPLEPGTPPPDLDRFAGEELQIEGMLAPRRVLGLAHHNEAK